MDRKELIRQAGIKRFGTEEKWREHLRQSSAKSKRNSKGTGGFNHMKRTDPERLREVSKKGGINGRKRKEADTWDD